MVGFLKGYPPKLLLLFTTVHLMGKLSFFDNCKLMYLLMALFLGCFYYGCSSLFSCFWWNYSWQWSWFCWRSCGVGGFEKDAYQVDLKKYLPTFVDTFLPKGWLNHYISFVATNVVIFTFIYLRFYICIYTPYIYLTYILYIYIYMYIQILTAYVTTGCQWKYIFTIKWYYF